MKITIYELLGMVKDGKAPKKIKYDGQEYKITKILLEDNNYYFNYINEDMECIFPINTNHLNDTVEILEEKKTKPLTKKNIEALGYACGEIQKCFTNGWTKSLENKPLEEENKIPEKLFFTHISNYNDQSVVNNNFNNYFKKTQETINEIIDYLKSKGE